MNRRVRWRVAVGGGVAVGLLAGLVGAGPAMADPARPTSYEAVIDAVEPNLPGLSVWVSGGDSFLWVEVERGRRLEVPGYQAEPYLRIESDGTVYLNRNSPAYWTNDDRYGLVEVPPGVSADAEPIWEVVAGGGRHGWHDHRIHWMTPDTPPWVEGSAPQVVREWTVPMSLDGEALEVRGTLTWFPAVSPVPWVLVATLAALVGYLASRRGAATKGWVVVAAAVPAGVVAVAGWVVTPPGAASWVTTFVPVLAGLVGGAVAIARRGGAGADTPAFLGAVVLVAWVGLRVSAAWAPVLPSGLPTTVERLLVATAGGLALGMVVATVTAKTSPAGTSDPRPSR